MDTKHGNTGLWKAVDKINADSTDENHILEIALSIPAVSGWNGKAMTFAGWTAIGSERVKRQGYWWIILY